MTKKKIDPKRMLKIDDASPEFIAFWQIYPRRDGRGKAKTALASALKKTTIAEIVQGVANYPFSSDPRFVPFPATFLNQERWHRVEISTPPTVQAPKQDRSTWRDAYDGGTRRPHNPWHAPGDVEGPRYMGPTIEGEAGE